MQINKDYISNNNSYANNTQTYIVVHNTDNFNKTANAKAHAKAQHDGNFSGMSAHFYTDDQELAYQALPYNRGAWHVGVNYGGKLFGTVNNRNSIGVEMCVNSGYDYEKAFQNTVALVKQLMKELNIDADHVVSHYDVCAKNCPSQIRAKGDWARFKQLIGAADENIKGVQIGDSNVEAVSKVVYGEAGVIQSRNGFLGAAQCIYDMLQSGQFGKTVTEVMEHNFSAYGSKNTSDDARQAVYDVFCKGVRRFTDAQILQFRSLTNYSDGNGNMDEQKCASLLQKYEYLGKDARNNQWGHLYFGHKVEAVDPEPLNKQNRIQCGSFKNKKYAENLRDQLIAKGFPACIKTGDDGQYKVQAGAYDVLSNAQKQLQRIKAAGFTAILKTADTAETAEESVHIILQQCQKFQKRLEEDLANGTRWEYHNPSKYLEEQWELALKNKKYASNCAHLARLAMKEAGLIPQDTGIFYGKLGGSISWGKGTKAAVQKNCTLISIQTKTVKQLINEGKLQPGDIVTYVSLQHTNIYAGNGKWYDAGHAYCSGSGEGAKYNSWYGDGKYDNQLVGWIIRKK